MGTTPESPASNSSSNSSGGGLECGLARLLGAVMLKIIYFA